MTDDRESRASTPRPPQPDSGEWPAVISGKRGPTIFTILLMVSAFGGGVGFPVNFAAARYQNERNTEQIQELRSDVQDIRSILESSRIEVALQTQKIVILDERQANDRAKMGDICGKISEMEKDVRRLELMSRAGSKGIR